MKTIAVVGAGSWGTALAVHLGRIGHDVRLWVREPELVGDMRERRENSEYLPGVALPPSLYPTNELGEVLDGVELVLTAVPSHGTRDVMAQVARVIAPGAVVVSATKGIEEQTLLRMSQVIAHQLGDDHPVVVLSGPSFALEVARGQPTALVAASSDAALAAAAVAAFHGEALRIYTSTDVVGVEVGGAVKNVLAIATGIVDGMPEAGLNARAALITRGLAEITRLGLALGARAETFMGLSGLGDLVLTATGELSRNRRVGLLLAAGQALPEALRALGHVAEGVPSAPTVLARARALGVEMPVTEAVVEVLEGRVAPVQAMVRLMARQARSEGETGV